MSFDYKIELEKCPQPNFWKAGLSFYIEKKKISIKSKKDFTKIVDEFNNLKLGE